MYHRIITRFLVALCLLLPNLPANAARLTLSGYADTNLDPAPPDVFSFVEDPATVGSLLGNGVRQAGGSFGAQVQGASSGHAALGRLGVAAEAVANGPSPSNTLGVGGEAVASTGWSDSFRIVPGDDALLGTRMRFRFVVHVSGGGNVVPNAGGPSPVESGFATYRAQLDVANCVACDLAASGRWDYNLLTGNSTTTFVGDPLAPDGIELGGFVESGFGATIGFSADLNVTAGAVSGTDIGGMHGGIRSFANLLGTLRWGGILELRDDQDSLVTDYTVVSESGTDWRLAAPVPIPASVWLLGTALAALRACCGRPGRAWIEMRGSPNPLRA
jgi:hypothetical protein